MFEVSAVLPTDGSGYWTKKQKHVTVIGLDIGYIDDDRDFGELRIIFDTASWDTKEDGLVYTDKLFLEQARDMLKQMGLAGDDVNYSEQGMQGKNFVSCDVGAAFIDSLASKFPEEFVEIIDD